MGNNRNHLTSLSNWLAPVAKGVYSLWKRCWRASVDGWAASTFHSRCDGKGPTVTIIRVGKYIFGGYTSVSWGKLLLLRSRRSDSRAQCSDSGKRVTQRKRGRASSKLSSHWMHRLNGCFFTFLRSCSSLTPPPPLILSYHHYFLNLKTILIISKLHLKLKSTYTAINIIII